MPPARDINSQLVMVLRALRRERLRLAALLTRIHHQRRTNEFSTPWSTAAHYSFDNPANRAALADKPPPYVD